MALIDTVNIDTAAGTYTLNIFTDDTPERPYNEGFVLVTNGSSTYPFDRRINLVEGDDPLIPQVQRVLHDSYDQYGFDWVSGEALVRWLRMNGRKGVTLVHVPSDYAPDHQPSTDRNDRIYGVAWAPDDATDPDAYVEAALREWHAWARGEIFGWQLLDPAGEHVDSCWGYYDIGRGRDECEEEAAGIAAHDAEQRVSAANLAGAGIVGII